MCLFLQANVNCIVHSVVHYDVVHDTVICRVCALYLGCTIGNQRLDEFIPNPFLGKHD